MTTEHLYKLMIRNSMELTENDLKNNCYDHNNTLLTACLANDHALMEGLCREMIDTNNPLKAYAHCMLGILLAKELGNQDMQVINHGLTSVELGCMEGMRFFIHEGYFDLPDVNDPEFKTVFTRLINIFNEKLTDSQLDEWMAIEDEINNGMCIHGLVWFYHQLLHGKNKAINRLEEETKKLREEHGKEIEELLRPGNKGALAAENRFKLNAVSKNQENKDSLDQEEDTNESEEEDEEKEKEKEEWLDELEMMRKLRRLCETRDNMTSEQKLEYNKKLREKREERRRKRQERRKYLETKPEEKNEPGQAVEKDKNNSEEKEPEDSDKMWQKINQVLDQENKRREQFSQIRDLLTSQILNSAKSKNNSEEKEPENKDEIIRQLRQELEQERKARQEDWKVVDKAMASLKPEPEENSNNIIHTGLTDIYR